MGKEEVIIFIFRKLNDEELNNLYSLSDVQINAIDSLLNDTKLNYNLIKKPKNLGELWKNTILKFTENKTNNQSNLFFFSSIFFQFSIWFYHKFRLYFNRMDVFFEINEVNKAINKKKKIIVYSNSLKINWFKSHENLKIINRKTTSKTMRNLSQIWRSFYLFFYRAIISNKKSDFVTKPFLMFNYLKNYSFTEIEDELIFNNKVWAELHFKNQNRINIIEESDIFINKEKYKEQNFKKLNKEVITSEYLILKLLLSPTNLIKVRKDYLNYCKNLKKLENNLKDPIHLMILDFYSSLNKSSLLYFIKFYSFYLFFKKSRGLKAIISHSENTSSGKIILDAARCSNISTVGIQHASINKQNIAYNFSKTEQEYNASPQHTLIWGKKTKEVLAKYGNYNENQLCIIGQLRSDAINFYKKENNNLEKNICFFSQPQPDERERILAAETIIKCASEYKKIKLLIKIHPNENENLYLKLIKQYKLNNVEIIKRNISLYKTLSKINYAITCFSTVGIEALLFDVPLIVFDSKKIDKAGFIRDDIAHVVSNKKELDNLFTEIDNNNLKIKPNYKKYVQEHFYAIDGKSNQRAMNFLESNFK